MIRIIKYLFLILIIIIFAGFGLYWYFINSYQVKSDAPSIFIVTKGEGVNRISANLYHYDLIKSKFFFETYVWLNKLESKFQAGEYTLEPGLNIKETVKVLTSGQTISRERTIKIIEGWRISDIGQYLEKENIITDGSFLNFAGADTAEWRLSGEKPEFLKDLPAGANLEGFLFPDTYRIFYNANANDIILKMLGNFDYKLDPQMRAEIASQGKSIYQIVTMASIIEKEVKSYEDMRIVSGIFWDRIKNGQALESCATLAYILGINKKQYSKEDTEIESSYNTYKNQGLPPGPICSPGLSAIKAAIYPVFTEYNYFLTASADGKTIFSRTYQEHLQNKGKYLE